MVPEATRFFLDSSSSAVCNGFHAEGNPQSQRQLGSVHCSIARPWGDCRLPRHAQGLLDGSFSATVDTAIMGRKSSDAGFEDERRRAAPLDDDDAGFLEL
jgi:hypothetical protein